MRVLRKHFKNFSFEISDSLSVTIFAPNWDLGDFAYFWCCVVVMETEIFRFLFV